MKTLDHSPRIPQEERFTQHLIAHLAQEDARTGNVPKPISIRKGRWSGFLSCIANVLGLSGGKHETR